MNDNGFIQIMMIILMAASLIVGFVGLCCQRNISKEIPICETYRTNGVLTVLYQDDDTVKSLTTKQASLYVAKDEDIAIQQSGSLSVYGDVMTDRTEIVHRPDLKVNQ